MTALRRLWCLLAGHRWVTVDKALWIAHGLELLGEPRAFCHRCRKAKMKPTDDTRPLMTVDMYGRLSVPDWAIPLLLKRYKKQIEAAARLERYLRQRKKP